MRSSSRLAALLAGAATLATPGLAEAKKPHHKPSAKLVTATVLSADRAHHSFTTAAPGGGSDVWTVAGALPKKVRLGSRVAFKARGPKAAGVRVVGHAKRLNLKALVVRAGRRHGVKLPDGVKLADLRGNDGIAQLLAALKNLKPGDKLSIEITIADDGTMTLTVTLPDGTVITPTVPTVPAGGKGHHHGEGDQGGDDQGGDGGDTYGDPFAQ